MKKLIFLAAAGGFLYAHRRRGGAWTLDSLRDTATDLFGMARQRVTDLTSRGAQAIDDRAGAIAH
ncbi:MAG TPA: hypothetical protein VL463_21425 [Kofleriaceae bacterium]|nr:hypothetical protein [Kofleriaceae bacterium]